jgi:hypothetical protein
LNISFGEFYPKIERLQENTPFLYRETLYPKVELSSFDF